MMAIEIGLWVVGCVAAMAFFEYIVHRWLMHGTILGKRVKFFHLTWEAHVVLHHGRYFPTTFFDHNNDLAAQHIDIELHPGKTLVEFSPVWGILLFFYPTGGAILVAVIAVHGVVWTTLHREMHCPK